MDGRMVHKNNKKKNTLKSKWLLLIWASIMATSWKCPVGCFTGVYFCIAVNGEKCFSGYKVFWGAVPRVATGKRKLLYHHIASLVSSSYKTSMVYTRISFSPLDLCLWFFSSLPHWFALPALFIHNVRWLVMESVENLDSEAGKWDEGGLQSWYTGRQLQLFRTSAHEKLASVHLRIKSVCFGTRHSVKL